MKIVGGKHQSPDEEMVAYVAAIYPGGIAEQLHGELEEGKWPYSKSFFFSMWKLCCLKDISYFIMVIPNKKIQENTRKFL